MLRLVGGRYSMDSALDGVRVNYDPSPIVWVEPGTNGQHPFYQLLHQGSRLVPCHVIAFSASLNPRACHHDLLMATIFAQTEALAFGKTADEPKASGTQNWLVPHRVVEGNRAMTTIPADGLTAQALALLVALYEHRVFTHGIIWRIDSFDQLGLELGKALAQRIGGDLQSDSPDLNGHDSSTTELMRR